MAPFPYRFALQFSVIALVFIGEIGLGWGATISLEAESADQIVFPAKILEIDGSVDGKCVRLSGIDSPDRFSQETEERKRSRGRGEIGFRFQSPQENTYTIWVRTQWHCLCSRNFELILSGVALGSGTESSELNGVRFADHSVPPLRWGWVRLGEFHFGAGEQEVRILQLGHMALLDRFVITDDREYCPPGYVEAERRVHIDRPSSDWAAGIEEGRFQRLVEASWRDFQADFTLIAPESEAFSSGSYIAFSFCRSSDSDAYELRILRNADGDLGMQLMRVVRGVLKEIGAFGPILVTQRKQHLRLVRKGDRILVTINGVGAFDSHDGSHTEGLIGFKAIGIDNVEFSELTIEPLVSYAAYFNQPALDWTFVGERWETGADPENPESGRVLLAKSRTATLAIPPWQLGNEYRLESTFRIYGNGSAGVVVDVVDESDYVAVVVGQQGKGGEDTEVQILRFAEGVANVLFAQALPGSPGQWREMYLLKDLLSLECWIDNTRVFAFESDHFSKGGRTGLIAGENTLASFTSVTGSRSPEIKTRQYLFDRGTDEKSLCDWWQKEGAFELLGHPALLVCKGADGDGGFCLELQRVLEGEAAVRILFDGDMKIAEEEDPFGAFWTPSVRLPVHLSGPRVGLFLELRGIESLRYEVSFDLESLRDAVIRRDGVEVQRFTLPHEERSPSGDFELRIAGEEAVFLRFGREIARIHEKSLADVRISRHAGIFGEYFSDKDSVSIMEMDVYPLYPKLEEVKFSESENAAEERGE